MMRGYLVKVDKMFENFSFTKKSRQPQSTSSSCDNSSNNSNDSISPTSSRSTSPPPGHRYITSCRIHLSMAELSHKLSAHNLQPRSPRLQSYSNLPTPPGDDETFFEDLSLPQPPSFHSTPSSASCRRLQRQSHARLQCDAQHLRALADLVEGMVSTGSQCDVYQPSSIASPRSCDGASPLPSHLTSTRFSSGSSSSDNGDADRTRSCRGHPTSTRSLAHKQSTEWSQDRACVMKRARMRKDMPRRGSGQVTRCD